MAWIFQYDLTSQREGEQDDRNILLCITSVAAKIGDLI